LYNHKCGDALVDLKMKPPIRIEGRAVLRGALGDIVAEQVLVTGVDSDGYVCLSLQVLPEHRNPDGSSATELGTAQGKTLVYHPYRLGADFQVVILGARANRVLKRRVTQNFLVHVFQRISEEGVSFNKIRLETKQAIDALQLKAALAILEVTGHVDCIRESNRAYYRRLKPWSLDI
jgi:hypothetical protein